MTEAHLRIAWWFSPVMLGFCFPVWLVLERFKGEAYANQAMRPVVKRVMDRAVYLHRGKPIAEALKPQADVDAVALDGAWRRGTRDRSE